MRRGAILLVLLLAAGAMAAGAGQSRAAGCRPKLLPHRGPKVKPIQTPAGLAIGIDGGYGSWTGCEVIARKRLGAAVTRHEWQPSEPVDAQDHLMMVATKKVHTRIEALLGGNVIEDAGKYRDFVVAFIRRYGEGGSFWREHPGLDASRYAIRDFELGNEPYYEGMSAESYAAAVEPTLLAVKQLNLPAQILLPSRVYGDDTSWDETLYQEIPDLNDLFYGFAEHPYWYGHSPAAGGPASPLLRLATLRNLMDSHGAGEKPIFITEYGESTADCGGECTSVGNQAAHLSRMITAILEHPQWKVAMLEIYQLFDRGTNSGSRELEFGLLRQDGQPKPAWRVLREAAARYRG